MYKIYFANLAKATGKSYLGKRPVVVINVMGAKVRVLKITSRMRDDFRHIRMNNYIISGFCDISQSYVIDKKYLLGYQRDCTTEEMELIDKAMGKRKVG